MARSSVAPLRAPLASLLPLALALVGCAGDLRLPDPPTGDPCTTYEDCAPAGEVACGPVRACVDGVCEASPSLHVACR